MSEAKFSRRVVVRLDDDRCEMIEKASAGKKLAEWARGAFDTQLVLQGFVLPSDNQRAA